MSLPFCTLPRKHFWDDEKWQKTAMELGLSTEYTRRNFEWTHTAYILSEAGLLHSEASGLGLGVGREPLPFYLSRFCAEIVGADNFEERWKKSEEADPGIIRTPSSYTKIPFNRDVLKFIRMDAREFKFSSHSFNFVWSCSSIEHMSNAWSGFHRAVRNKGGRFFPFLRYAFNHNSVKKILTNIRDSLRPGGYAVITTELILDGPPHPEMFTKKEIEKLFTKIPGLRPAGDFHPEADPFFMSNIQSRKDWHTNKTPHVFLHDGDRLFTSVCIVLIKN